jgi:GalNAc-alpha-(1->4)-GalNAc-alpha-(1->3)-diNAcBac-PP-undecaprenol alpha-1,4-N-acetyl-D-galactosaminyltransferase
MHSSWMLIIPSLGCGGTERTVTVLANELQSKGAGVTVVSFIGKGNATNSFFKLNGIHHRVIQEISPSTGILSALVNNWFRIRKIRKCILEEKPNIVASFLTQINILTVIASVGLTVKVVVSERNNISVKPERRVWKMLRRITYPYADRITGNSTELVEQLAREIRSTKIELVRNLLVQPRLNDSFPGEKQKFVLNVGRLVSQKNHDLLIRAFARTEISTDGWNLILVGDGERREDLDALVNTLGIQSKVRFVGEHQDTKEWYLKSSIFVLTSNYEGMPNAVLEAMSYGMTVICTEDCGGVNDVIETGHNGYVLPKSETLIARYLDLLARDSKTRGIIGANASKSVKRFRAESAVEDWLRIGGV